MQNKKSILILYTGGTIGMKSSRQGYVPAANFLSQQLAKFPEFNNPDMPNYQIEEYQPLLDSANMNHQNWQQMTDDIVKNYDDFDGFVILHGTDTMAYSASALSFLLENLGKPVIFTGSQVPLIETHTDARENLLCSLIIASHYDIPEVCVFFNNKLFRGNRTRKLCSSSFNAFASPNFPLLGKVGVNINIIEQNLLPKPKNKCSAAKIDAINLIRLPLFPSLSLNLLENILNTPDLDACIFETFGTGNAPSQDPRFAKILHKATSNGVLLVNCSQCPSGKVSMSDYKTGKVLLDAGVISAADMTPEAIIAKLFYLFSQQPKTKIKALFQQNLRGEIDKEIH